ncbi:MAG: carboxylating nicotinate-nucleotide diphosphorylase [Armatimonadota bacterium]
MKLDPLRVEPIVKTALEEDIGNGDITTHLTVPDHPQAEARIISKSAGVLAGIEVARLVFAILDPEVAFKHYIEDGSRLEPGMVIATLTGSATAILSGERVALNFLQRMSGIATLTHEYVRRVAHTKAKIVDTRKTAPGLRYLDKYSVNAGGGYNHRFGLYDGILIKDNHIVAAGGVSAAVKAAKCGAPHTLRVEVEVTSLEQLKEAIDSGADAVLLDNMPVKMVRKAVELAAGNIVLEVSGGITLDNVAEIAETGVDLISVGALTHSAAALDLSMVF